MDLATPDVRPVYAVIGRDRFLCGEALAQVLRILAQDMDDLGPMRFEGPQAELADVLDEVRTVSLLGNRRVVIVDDAGSFITAHRAALERYCAAPAQGGVLILMCQTLPKNTRLYRIINDNGAALHCEAPKGRAIVAWIVNHAQDRYDKRMSPAAAQRLRDHVGDAFGTLDSELSKLSAYVGECDEITPGDVGALTGHHREEKVFAVTDAMASNDPAGALRHWEQVLATDRAAPNRAIAGLAWGVRRLLEACRDWESGMSIRALATRMYTDPALLKRRLERVTTARLEAQQRDLLAADLAVKTGASTINSAVEKFIVKHSVAGPEVGQAAIGSGQ